MLVSPQAQIPIDSFRVHEAIELTGRIRGGDGPTVRRHTDELIEALDIGKWRKTMGQQLSGGSSGWWASPWSRSGRVGW